MARKNKQAVLKGVAKMAMDAQRGRPRAFNNMGNRTLQIALQEARAQGNEKVYNMIMRTKRGSI